MKGQVVGLVYGGAPGKRGAFNTGIGYGLPINTAKNFLAHMRAGIFCDHATLGATVNTQISEEGDVARLVVNQVLEDSDTSRRGLAEGDELLELRRPRGPRASTSSSRPSASTRRNGGCRSTYKRGNEKKETLVRLMSYTPPVIRKAPTGPGTAAAAEAEGIRRGGQVLRGAEGLRQLLLQPARTRPRARQLEEAGRLLDRSPASGSGPAPTTARTAAATSSLKMDEVPDPADPKGPTRSSPSSSA